MKAYAYVDGAFLRDRASFAIRQMLGCEPELDFNNVRNVLQAQRLFYYDCVELESRTGEAAADFELRTKSMSAMLKHIGSSPMCHVRLGTLKQRQGRRRISQKEVDVKVAVDMLTHAAARSVEKAILLTGDLDFRPVVESLVQLGIVVEIAHDPLVTAGELLEAADIRRALDIHGWVSMCSNEFQRLHPIPIRWIGDRGDQWRQINTGTFMGVPVRLWESIAHDFTVEIEGYDEAYGTLCIKAANFDLLVSKYVPGMIGLVNWDRPLEIPPA
jgi:uncharacterized LabA/DUF88 family protein